MTKKQLSTILGVLSYLLVLSVFFLPDEYVYIKHVQDTYKPLFYNIASVSSVITLMASIIGWVTVWNYILNQLED